MKYKTDEGCESITNAIREALFCENMQNVQPNAILLSKEAANKLVDESPGNLFKNRNYSQGWKTAIGGQVYGMEILIVKNRPVDQIELLEIERNLK